MYNKSRKAGESQVSESPIKITLRAARVNKGYSIQEAAEMIGVSRATLTNYERGYTCPNWEKAEAISRVYGIPLNNIIFPKN